VAAIERPVDAAEVPPDGAFHAVTVDFHQDAFDAWARPFDAAIFSTGRAELWSGEVRIDPDDFRAGAAGLALVVVLIALARCRCRSPQPRPRCRLGAGGGAAGSRWLCGRLLRARWYGRTPGPDGARGGSRGDLGHGARRG
jgi:hypothetical protein